MRRLGLFCLAGLLVVVFGISLSPAKSWAAYGDFITTFPNQTSVAGALLQPTKIAVDPANGNVYVTDDEGNVNNVKEYDKNGNFLSKFVINGTPVGIAVDANNIFVGDSTNKCVWIYDKTGALTNLSGTNGNKLPAPVAPAPSSVISFPDAIAVAPSGQIFVVDGDNDGVLIYNADGTYNAFFGGSGSTTGYFYFPSGIAFANSSVSGSSVTQYFYVGDQGNYRVQKWYYVYNNTTNAITTAPTYYQTIGSEGDGFGQFLRVNDVAFDNTHRLIILDSLQMVGQIFQNASLYTSSSNPCRNASNYVALNYCVSSVAGNLNTPTGMAVYMGDQTTPPRVYVANNQSKDISVFTTQDGNIPTITITNPTSAVVPCTATYTIQFSGTDADSTAETVKLYYYNTNSPTVKTLFSTQAITVTSGTFSGSATLDLVGTFPNFMMAGTYGIYAEVSDENNNIGTADSGPSGTVGITNVAGEGKYTCSMVAKWGDGLTTDTDGDGLSNADEINGTYNTAFGNAPTDPTNADTDGDGLDDGVEEGVVPLNSNKTIPINYTGPLVDANGKLINHTNPNAKDTDGDGVSDAVEIAKGTDPTNGSDGMLSETDVDCAYFIDGTNNWESILGLLNASPNPLVADLIFYKLDGTIAATVQAVKFGNNASMKLSPSTYGATEGSVEIRTTQGPALAGFRASYLQDIYGGGVYDTGYGSALTYSPATHVYVPYMDSGAWRFQGYANLKNVTNGTINVTATYSLTTNASGTVLNPPTVTTKAYTLLPHETLHLDPAVEAAPGEVIISFDSDTPKSLVGTYYENRYNASNSNVWDYGQEEPMGVSPSTVSYCSLFDSGAWRFKGWYSIMNPGINTVAANPVVSFNLTTSGTSLSNLVGFYTKSISSMIPGSYYTQRLESDMLTPDTTRTPTPTGTIPNPNPGEGTFKVTSDVPVFADLVNFRYNATNTSVYDYGFAVPNPSTSSPKLYGAYFDDSDTDRYKTWLQVGNPSETATVTVIASFYDANGNLLPATLSPAQNPYTITIAPRGLASFRPRDCGLDEPYRIGSVTLAATGGNIIGYLLAQKWDIDGNQNLYDYSYAYNLQPIPYPPAPVQLRVASTASTQVGLAWEANPSFHLAGYNVLRSTTSGNGYVQVNTSLVTSNSYTDTTVTTGTTYYYVIQAVDINANVSGNSGEVIAKP